MRFRIPYSGAYCYWWKLTLKIMVKKWAKSVLFTSELWAFNVLEKCSFPDFEVILIRYRKKVLDYSKPYSSTFFISKTTWHMNITSNFLKTVFRKFYLVRSWILCSRCSAKVCLSLGKTNYYQLVWVLQCQSLWKV